MTMNDSEARTPEDWIGRMAREHYNPPPPTPREEIWEAVQARLQEPTLSRDGGSVEASSRELGQERSQDLGRDLDAGGRGGTPVRRFRAGWLALAASAVLALGVGLGRWSRTAPSPTPTPVAEVGAGDASHGANRTPGPMAARWAAVETLVRSEPLLATVRAEAARGGVDAEVGAWARKILGDTRFLLDSGLPLDPQVRALLEDLELVLLQTTLVGSGGLDGPRAREELELLRQGMDDKDVLTRIQAVLPGSRAGI